MLCNDHTAPSVMLSVMFTSLLVMFTSLLSYAYIPPWLYLNGTAVATVLSTSESFKWLIYIRAQVFLPSQRAVNCHARISKIQTKLIEFYSNTV